MLLLSIGFAALAVLLLRGRLRDPYSPRACALLVLSILLASSFWLVSDQLTGHGIDESVTWHLRAGLTGAAFSEFLGPIALGLVLLGLSAGIALLAYREVRVRAGNQILPATKRWRPLAAVSSLIASCWFNPAVLDLRDIYAEELPREQRALTAAQAADTARIKFPRDKKNLVVLYLESFERTWLDQTLFPNLTPQVAALDKQALSFTNIGQYYGDSWTIAGMVSSQCGVPLALPESQHNAMSGLETFLPGATCLGDLLSLAGYRLEFMGGADLEFAGKGNFYKSHGFAAVRGLDQLEHLVDDPSYRNPWGLQDDSLLALFRRRFDRLAAEGQPFGLFGLTVNTHHPRGMETASCVGMQYEEGNDPILNAVQCADRMVGDLVTQLRSSPAWKDTVLVIVSDHLALENTAWERLNKGNRKNLLLVLGDGVEPREVNTPAALIDVAPTLLGLLGAKGGASLGFGRDMLGEAPTLATSVKGLRKELRAHRSELNMLWQFPQLTDGLRVDIDRARLSLGGSTVRVPALLLTDPDMRVREFRFKHRAWELTDSVARLPFDQSFLWVDDCKKVGALASDGERPKDAALCLAAGSLGAGAFTVVPLGNSAGFTLEQIRSMWDPSSALESRAAARVAALKKMSRHGFASRKTQALEPQRKSSHLPWIAHAGGGYQGRTYTNSLAALTHNRDRYQLFEIDLSWTSDGHLVCLHDWQGAFGQKEERKASLADFLESATLREVPAPCTLQTLVDWVRANPSKRIVTDVKEDNLRALTEIARDYPELRSNFIPQIYSPDEYRVARSLGFEDIIWTLYRMRIPEEEILRHLETLDLYALTMPVRRAETGLAQRAAEATGVLSYVHTLNSAQEFEHFRMLGVNSLYTDFLSEAEAPSP